MEVEVKLEIGCEMREGGASAEYVGTLTIAVEECGLEQALAFRANHPHIPVTELRVTKEDKVLLDISETITTEMLERLTFEQQLVLWLFSEMIPAGVGMITHLLAGDAPRRASWQFVQMMARKLSGLPATTGVSLSKTIDFTDPQFQEAIIAICSNSTVPD